MSKNTIVVLEKFNRKVEKLNSFSFSNHGEFQASIKFRASTKGKVGGRIEATEIRPAEEAIDAFLLTLRFFIQNNEDISFKNIANIYQSELPSGSEILRDLIGIRKELNNYLDEKSFLTIYGENPTNRRILEVFLYGNSAHGKDEKEITYNRWKKDGIIHSFAHTIFLGVVADIFNAAKEIALLNEELIEYIGKSTVRAATD